MRQVPIDLVGSYRGVVEARGDLYECLVNVAIDLCGLLDLFAPVQEVRYRVAIDALGIVRDGLELKGLRRLGNGLFEGGGQCVVHVCPFCF